MRNNVFATIVLTFFVFAVSALTYPAALRAESQKGIDYISGGFGAEERDALSARESEYNLSLLFAAADGDYLGGADIQIKNAKGDTVLQTTAEGPWLFARLPQGDYTVMA